MSAPPAIYGVTWGEGDGTGGGSGSSRLLYSQTSIQGGDTIGNTNAATSFISSTFTIPANTFTLGSVLRISSFGTWHTAALAPQLDTSLLLDSVGVAASGSLLQIANVVDRLWDVDVSMTCTSTGSTGTLEIQGRRIANTGATSSRVEGMVGGSSIVDTTSPMVVSLQITWSAADPDNNMTMRQFEALFTEVA